MERIEHSSDTMYGLLESGQLGPDMKYCPALYERARKGGGPV